MDGVSLALLVSANGYTLTYLSHVQLIIEIEISLIILVQRLLPLLASKQFKRMQMIRHSHPFTVANQDFTGIRLKIDLFHRTDSSL